MLTEEKYHMQDCWDHDYMVHCGSGGDANCICPPPSGEENGVPYDAYCIECMPKKQRVVQRLGAWICPAHQDRGHVEFVARLSSTEA